MNDKFSTRTEVIEVKSETGRVLQRVTNLYHDYANYFIIVWQRIENEADLILDAEIIE
jgi:hypothetical protein